MPEGAVRHRIVGTAGHIDHGKTALVRALTGVETDRLPEEQRRGITIELGFASWKLGDELVASVIDVPGHERFVRTMVAGAAGVDLVLLVVAADDGVMPQTREHLAVCTLLGIERGIVVVTKADLVDDEMRALVEDDVALAVQGTFLEKAPVFFCSALTGAGIPELRDAVASALASTPAKEASGPAFLPIDRAFTRPGFGSVVTGTLLTGSLAVGGDVDVVPGPRGRPLGGLKVRGLQVHGAATEEVQAGTRVAVNLRGVETEDLRRGDVVVSGGSRAATRSLLAEVRLLGDAPALEERDELSVHLGTKGALAKVTPLGSDVIPPGGTGFVRVTTMEPVAAFADQRFVLRKPGLHGQGTVGGGRVLDPSPVAGKGAHARWTELAQRLAEASDLEPRAAALIVDARARGLSEEELRARMPPAADVSEVLGRLARAKGVLQLPGAERRWADATLLDAVADKALAMTRAFHKERPLLSGLSPKELETRLPPPLRGLMGAALDELTRSKRLVAEDGLVRLPSHKAAGASKVVLEKLEGLLLKAGLTPPLDEEARKALAVTGKELKDALAELKRQGRVQRLGDLHFHISAITELKASVTRFFASEAQLTTSSFKELAGGVSRKYAIPLLEWLDAEGVTKRQGDVRVQGRA